MNSPASRPTPPRIYRRAMSLALLLLLATSLFVTSESVAQSKFVRDSTATDSLVVCTTTTAVVLADNPIRFKFAVKTSSGSSMVYLSKAATATLGRNPMKNGEGYNDDGGSVSVYSGPLSCITPTGTVNLFVTED